ncbi:MAG: endonuclease III [Acidocella sp. 20-57-95]|nr:MAG: endonuclease III [Acidocella sp. 20-57-95]HQT65169.1 endonuclease III [Acidocella sp.]HQU04555.1 endonuclease III [Acidocella sp.]
MSEAAKTKRPKLMKAAHIAPFLTAIAAGNPDPKTELDYQTPYQLLVAVVMSAQTTDVAVNKVTKTLFAEAPTPQAMVALGVQGVGSRIKSIGLWQAKAKNVVALSAQLLELHGGEVPGAREALEALPGVGRKTANVVLNEIFGQATMAVDTHIFRLGNRTGIAPGATPRAVEDGLLKRVPKDMLKPAHLWLILHGRYVCKARTPECWRCAGAAFCVFKPKTRAPLGKGT